jgi:hypothetical protein
VETLGIELVEIAEDAALEELGVQRGDAVDAWLPTVARCAIRTHFSPCSLISETRATRASSFGKRARTSSRNRRLISKMISRWRGSSAREQRQRPLLERLGQSV